MARSRGRPGEEQVSPGGACFEPGVDLEAMVSLSRTVREMNLAGRAISSAVAGYGVTFLLILSGLVATGLPWRDIPTLGSVITAGFTLVVLAFLPSWPGSRLRMSAPSRGRSVLLGVASGSVAAVAVAYVFEGFEHGALSLLLDLVFWIWLVGFALGGASVGWLCQASRETGAH